MKHHIKIYIVLAVLFTSFACSKQDDVGPFPDKDKTILEAHQKKLKYVTVGRDKLAYLEYGKKYKKTLILLHGIPTSSLLYRNVAQAISIKTGYRVIALDLLGYGSSDKPVREGIYSIASQSQRVYDFANALNIDQFVLGIHDLGGVIGWQMLLNSDANKISGLFVSNTALEFEGFSPPSPVAPIFGGLATPRDHFTAILSDSAAQRQMTLDFLEDGLAKPEILTDELLDAYAAGVTEKEAYIGNFEAFNDFVAVVPEIKVALQNFDKPKSILWGGEDTFLDANVMGVNIKNDMNVSDEDFVILPNTSHYLQEDSPIEYIKHISKFLNTKF